MEAGAAAGRLMTPSHAEAQAKASRGYDGPMASLRRLPRLTVLALLALAAPAAGLEGLAALDAPTAPDDPRPLGGEAPAWWTSEVAEKARAAAKLGLAYDYAEDELVDLAAAYPSQAFLRPGTQILTREGAINQPGAIGLCTAAFTFDQRTLISTAGHCADVGEAVYAVALPYPVVFQFGTTVASTGSGGIGNDWALVSIDAQWQPFTDSDAAWISGPHGAATTVPTAFPTLLKHVGHGLGAGAGGTPRVALLNGGNDVMVSFTGLIQPGDSGSPILLVGTPGLSDDAALGIVTHKACERCTLAYATRVTLIPATVDDGDGLPLAPP